MYWTILALAISHSNMQLHLKLIVVCLHVFQYYRKKYKTTTSLAIALHTWHL